MGVPALAFFAASRLMERDGRDDIVRFVESLAINRAASFFRHARDVRYWGMVVVPQ
jgi:hypothetical protein